METRAAVAFETKRPLEVVELDLEGPCRQLPFCWRLALVRERFFPDADLRSRPEASRKLGTVCPAALLGQQRRIGQFELDYSELDNR